MLNKIISGGQTGADRGALDAAIACGVQYGGAIPKGRRTEDGPLPQRYMLQEMATTSYPVRTEKNVMDGDGTSIISHGPLSHGSFLTQKLAIEHGRPCIHIDLNKLTHQNAVENLLTFIRENSIEILNIAGSRASGDPEIYDAVYHIVTSILGRTSRK